MEANKHGSFCAIWETIKGEVGKRIAQEEFSVWFQCLSDAVLINNVLTIKMPSPAFRQAFNDRYSALLAQCIHDLNFAHVSFEMVIEKDSDKPAGELYKDSENEHQPFSRSLHEHGYLNTSYTFENFVRGPSNQFALASCQNVANNPGRNYNPLFIYGFSGLGKTHLLHALGNRVRTMRSDAVITYISSERFMNEMIYCLRINKMWVFRQKYRHCDILLIDDIQFISGKRSTQEEFFHTFNSLYEEEKQIVLTSDQYPHDIPDIEDRLRNRFRWGLIADIQPPDTEHRIAILLNKAEQLEVKITSDVAEYIAINIKRNVRELEGALHRIAAFSVLQGTPIDLQITQEIFRNVFEDSHRELTVEDVQKHVAKHFKIKVADLKSESRLRSISVPRQIAMYLCRTLFNASYPEIGNKFGGKDHTSAIYAYKSMHKKRDKDLEIKVHLETLERTLGQKI